MWVRLHFFIVCLLISFAVTISWNKYLEDVEDPLEEIPDEHLPLLVLLGVESCVGQWSVINDLVMRFVTATKQVQNWLKRSRNCLSQMDPPMKRVRQSVGITVSHTE